jgi:hypothetical protein
MNIHTKMQLNVSRIASRGGGVSLAQAGKGRRNALGSRLNYPSNPTSRPSGILRPGQKINGQASAERLLPLSGSRFDTARIQSP